MAYCITRDTLNMARACTIIAKYLHAYSWLRLGATPYNYYFISAACRFLSLALTTKIHKDTNRHSGFLSHITFDSARYHTTRVHGREHRCPTWLSFWTLVFPGRRVHARWSTVLPVNMGRVDNPWTHHITSHHIETTDAGLNGLCIREINVYHTNL